MFQAKAGKCGPQQFYQTLKIEEFSCHPLVDVHICIHFHCTPTLTIKLTHTHTHTHTRYYDFYSSWVSKHLIQLAILLLLNELQQHMYLCNTHIYYHFHTGGCYAARILFSGCQQSWDFTIINLITIIIWMNRFMSMGFIQMWFNIDFYCMVITLTRIQNPYL